MSAFSFNALVTGLTNEERLEMLQKIEEHIGTDLEVPDVPELTMGDMFDGNLERKFQSESFFVRFIFWLRTLFFPSHRSAIYTDYLIHKRATTIENSFPGLIDYRRKVFLNEFYLRMQNLRDMATFFLPYVTPYEGSHGDFYVSLSTIVLPNLFDSLLDEHMSPEMVKDEESKILFLHHFDEILQSIPSTEKNTLYSYVQTADWLRQFVHLPFHRICGRFFSIEHESNICQMASLREELPEFAKVLCNIPKIQSGFLEALILFVNKGRLKSEGATISENSDDIAVNEEQRDSSQPKSHMEIYAQIPKMVENLRYIKNFTKIVPIIEICSILFEDYYWAPAKLSGVEDWFFTLKSQWKSFFENMWENMTTGQKRNKAFANICAFFKTKVPPMLENRPWEAAWCDITFKYEFSLAFVSEFFKQYGEFVSKNLKILLMEGEFILKKNRVEFTDAINIFNHLEISLTSVNYDLLPQGDIGNLFIKAEESDNHTLQERSKLNNAMTKFSEKSENLIMGSIRMMDSLSVILKGITANTKNGYYESIYNLATIQDAGNTQFRDNLAQIEIIATNAKSILGDFYALEKEAKKEN